MMKRVVTNADGIQTVSFAFSPLEVRHEVQSEVNDRLIYTIRANKILLCFDNGQAAAKRIFTINVDDIDDLISEIQEIAEMCRFRLKNNLTKGDKEK